MVYLGLSWVYYVRDFDSEERRKIKNLLFCCVDS